jgi:hypothetical protein
MRFVCVVFPTVSIALTPIVYVPSLVTPMDWICARVKFNNHVVVPVVVLLIVQTNHDTPAIASVVPVSEKFTGLPSAIVYASCPLITGQ